MPPKILALVVRVLCQLETGDNPEAKDNGDAAGIGQVKTCVIHHLNDKAGFDKWHPDDRRDPVKCQAIMLEYLTLTTKDWMNYRGVAMLYKKGPDGMFRQHSYEDMDYAERFENLLEEGLKEMGVGI